MSYIGGFDRYHTQQSLRQDMVSHIMQSVLEIDEGAKEVKSGPRIMAALT